MPVVIELRLRADRAFEPATRQLHGLACALFEGTQSPDHASQDKPFTVWPLGHTPEGWLLRAAWLPPGFPQAVLAGCGQLRLGPVTYAVTDLAFHPVPHAGLANGSAASSIDVTIHSPAYFSQNGQHVIVPDPRLIVGSWRRRWNASLPPDDELAITEEQWRDLHQALTLTAFDLHTETRDTGHGRQQPGFTGTLTLRLGRTAPPEGGRILGTLARFAEFSGTGAQTTHGFGATTITAARVHNKPTAAAAP
jgi:CRISPR-associated endoribonuclease Cas6